jgi:GntR family transcriptional regulator
VPDGTLAPFAGRVADTECVRAVHDRLWMVDHFRYSSGNIRGMTAAAQPDPRAYMRLAALIREQIADGRIMPGSQLPSIAALRREQGHSRQTVGKAMHVLEGEGLIYRVPGLGYYVSCDAAGVARF